MQLEDWPRDIRTLDFNVTGEREYVGKRYQGFHAGRFICSMFPSGTVETETSVIETKYLDG